MDRGYRTTDAWGSRALQEAGTRTAFLKKVYMLFTASVVFSAIGAMVALYAGTSASSVVAGEGLRKMAVPPLVALVAQHPFITLALSLGAVFGASCVRHIKGVNVVALFGMATLLGILFAPALFVAQLRAGIGGTLSA